MSDFSQWFSEQDEVLYPAHQKPEFEDAYEAGRKAGLEEAAETLEQAAVDYGRGNFAEYVALNETAAAIRERMK